MERIEMWLDEETLKHLKNISRKLASPDNQTLSEEEILAMKKINHYRDFPPHVLKYFLAQGLTPEIQKIS